ncbi:MAG: hypothetical protein HY262_12760, partial [Chloroflexi bacterium]|nr:hypothetical protein [Chloroflexota bacterium]
MSVEFEPVKLGPRRRRLDPVVVLALAVAIGLVVAIVKPWNGGTSPTDAVAPSVDAIGGNVGAASPRGAVRSTPPPPEATPSPAVALPEPASTASYAGWDRVRVAVHPHDTWGIRAIVGRPSGLLAPAGDLRYEEVWSPLPPARAGTPTIDIEPDDQTVVAIGITFPPAHTPIDTRVWLVRPDRLDWVPTQALEPSPSGGGFLYRVIGDDGTVRNWAAGRY